MVSEPVFSNISAGRLRAILQLTTLFLTGCYGAWINPDGSSISACIIENDQIVNAPCLVDGSYFLYDQANGGRADLASRNVDAVIVTGASSSTIESVIPDGWSSGSTVFSMNSPLALVPGNIRAGVQIFGVTGTIATVQVPACNSGQNSVACAASIGKYFYDTAYNGRDANCTINGETDSASACYVSGSGTYYLVSASNLGTACSVQGMVSAAAGCRGPKNSYFYTLDRGGRSVNCASSTGTISGPCWLTVNAAAPVDIVLGTGTGSSSCTDNSVNSSVCLTKGNNRYVYTSAFGGRSTICGRNNDGNCYIDKDLKSTLEPNLKPEFIKAGIKIFGVTGSFGGLGVWGSGAHRDPLYSQQLLLTQETSSYAGSEPTPDFPSGYHEVPLVTIDATDGSVKIDDDGSLVPHVDRSSWGATTCGLTQTSISAKISDCGSILGMSATWEGAQKGNASQGKWVLVSRNAQKKEVWKDMNTGMLWSSLVSTGTNWCKASGSNFSIDVQNLGVSALVDNDPDGICTSPSYQNTTGNAVSACFEGTGFTSADSSIASEGKVGLGQSSNPKVAWRIPTLYDFEIAEYNGIRFVLPDYGFNRSATQPQKEWTGTISTVSAQSEEAWAIDSITGEHMSAHRSNVLGVRCIGR